MRYRFHRPRLLAVLAFCALAAGCAQPGAPSAVPSGFAAFAPNAAPTPPVTAPVTIPYPYVNNWTTTTYSGPGSKGKTTPGSDTGVTTVKFAVDPKTGVYDVPETIASKSGYVEVLNSAIGFYRYRGGIAQIILSDNFSYVAGPFVQTGMDTYPQTQNSIDFPMTPGRAWSAAATHVSYTNAQLSGKGAYGQNSSVNENADGTYASQTNYSRTKGGANQDNYASTASVSLTAPSTYSLAMPAAGMNELTQTFALPAGGTIAVTNSGKRPLPAKRGTVKVKDWYPGGGALPSALYKDDFRVIGTATTPSTCKSRAGQSATHVVESFANLDPVAGFYNTYTADYYLLALAKGQFWFACIVENYTNDNYANGWVFAAGHWGGLTSHQVGTETLIASAVKPGTQARGIRPNVPVLPFPSLPFRVAPLVERGRAFR
ncbi:MAG: hypothetical protein JO192_11265 [Candidatus Eremiobacteraeota bacterium]|nr:hypothetical protein [Candidatus Eremiobacteraeota bacterium]